MTRPEWMTRQEWVIREANIGGPVYIMSSFLLLSYFLYRFHQYSTYSLLSLFTSLSDPIKNLKSNDTTPWQRCIVRGAELRSVV